MKYRKKPVVIEAVRWTGNNEAEMMKFISAAHSYGPDGNFLKSVFIETLEGEMEAKPGDWIIKGIAGEFYPCKPDIFDQTYDAVEEQT